MTQWLRFILVCSVLILGGCQNAPVVTTTPTPTVSQIPETSPSPPPVSAADRKAAQNYRQLGLQARQQGNFPKAIQLLEKAIALDPINLSGQVLLGWTYHLAGKANEATATLEKATTQDPNNIEALNALGIVYLVSGQLTEAIKTHQAAVALKPNNEIAHYNLSLAYQRLPDLALGVKHGEAATKLEPSNPHPFVALALVYWDKGDKAKAKQLYRQAIALDGRYRQSGYLSHLKLAGFSEEQIQLTRQIQLYSSQ